MNDISRTKTRLRLAILLLVTFVAISSVTFVYISISNRLQSQINQEQFESLITNEDALQEYYQDQAGFEAHFVTAANIIKEDQLRSILLDLAVFMIPLLIISIAFSYYLSKYIINPIQESYDSKQRFMQDAAHELRNPLGAIDASTQAILDSNEIKTESEIQTIQSIQRQVGYLINLSNDLLFLEDNKKTKKVKLDLNEVVQDVLDQLKHLANEKNVQIKFTPDSKVQLYADLEDIVILLRNLFSNAIKYSKPEGGKVAINISQNKRRIIIVVKDNGIGMSEVDLKNIGSRFYRSSNAQSRQGSGLGLSIVKKILDKYSGKMKIESELDKGTTIQIVL